MQASRLSATPNSPHPRIDGVTVPGSYGTTFYPLPPGRHRIDVALHWTWTYGEAGMEVDVAPGQTVPVFYAPPWHTFSTGSMGHTQQDRKGLLAMIVMVIAILAVIFVCCVGPLMLVD